MKTCWMNKPLAGWMLGGLLWCGTAAAEQAPQLTTLYQNIWAVPSPGGDYLDYYKPGVGVAFYGGVAATNVWVSAGGTATTNSFVSPGGLRLDFAAFGQPVESQVAQYALGEVIVPPVGVDTTIPPAGFVPCRVGNNEAAYYESTNPKGGAFWVPSTKQVYAAAGGNVEIFWNLEGGGTLDTVYTIASVPESRPARLFWTESPYYAPAVQLTANGQQVFAAIHYNNYVTHPSYTTVTNIDITGAPVEETNTLGGVWFDGAGQGQSIRAEGVEGIFLLEYFVDGTYRTSLGVQPVQVMPPTIVTIDAGIGSRLLPEDHYYGTGDLIPMITTSGTDSHLFLMQQDGPKYNWLYGLKKTTLEPWNAEVYWEHKDSRGISWPFEVDWYRLDWPADAIRVALGDNPATDTPPVILPQSLTAILANEEPDVATISPDGRALTFSGTGHALLQYNSTDNVWFDVLKAVRHDDATEYDPTSTTWEIGKELQPFLPQNKALYFNGRDAYISAALEPSFSGANDGGFTVEAWVNRLQRINQQDAPIVAHSDASALDAAEDWELAFDSRSTVSFRTHGGTASYSFTGVLDLLRWHHIAGVYDGSTISLYIDGELAQSVAATSTVSTLDRHLTIGYSPASGHYFSGRLDEIRLWNRARTAEEIRDTLYETLSDAVADLAVVFNLDEGDGRFVRNQLTGGYGQLHGNPVWVNAYHLLNGQNTAFTQNPGYLYDGSAYNVNRYDYPTPENPDRTSHIFAVNEDHFEVWWARSSANADIPENVFYPSIVQHYDTIWPLNAPEIVLAAGKGSGADHFISPALYVQNNPDLPGYNPNEEHAVLLNGSAFAFRNDLNEPGGRSAPFVLVDDVEPGTGRPVMYAYHVVQTNAQYGFHYTAEAGAALVPPMPLEAFVFCEASTAVSGPAWRDRKTNWWAKAAGNDGGGTNAVMRFYYPMQPSFIFPELATQPEEGTELPWLPTAYVSSGTKGTPHDLVYDLTWPADIPELKIAQTLTTASGGLPDIWNQLSVEVVYQQSETNGNGSSVVLFDPVVETAVDLPYAVIQEMEALSLARRDWTSPRYLFDGLAPSLRSRLYYDPNRGSEGQLVLSGLLHSPLTGTPYILPNWLDVTDRAELSAMGESLSGTALSTWTAVINEFPHGVTELEANEPFANAALSAAISSNAQAVGYVTLAFNNSTNRQQVEPALPVSLGILKVVPELYSSLYLDVLESDNALDEKLSMRYPLDFGGEETAYEFEWRYSNPEMGGVPTTPHEEWHLYGDITNGVPGVNIGGGSTFMLSDHYFAVRYRRADGLGPTGDTWSDWVSSLAPGWIQRVMTGINPYEQRLQDMAAHAPSLLVSMIAQAGAPYEGPVALNAEAADSAGLIQIYQTVLERALSMTLAGGLTDSNTSDSLLFAASRLCDLYMLLGNEAYADAMDPTIGFGNDGGWFEHYGAMSTSLFPFMNQVATRLDEELALLRGRDDSMSPEVTITPVYNRLIWNYTHGIDAGEVAYAVTYNIKGDGTNSTGVISAENAKLAYPQGHGDAWGHYLSALNGFYRLLSYTNFGWNVLPGATMVGNATVSVDYFDEQKFAEAAAAKARAGVEIVNRTYRRDYQPDGLLATTWDFYDDANTNRQWGVDGWASRAGQGAYFDWVTANSLMLDAVTNLAQLGGDDLPAEGLYLIDRARTPELDEIAANLRSLQTQMDHVDLKLNPLGLDPDALPFDISAAEMDDGKTHFEQIYDRALAALQNAHTAFKVVQDAVQSLREQSDSSGSFAAAATASDIAYNNQLIEIFGYPYADDIGVGKTYPQGYGGPDLLNYQIMDLDNTLGLAPTGGTKVSTAVYNIAFNTSGYAYSSSVPVIITAHINEQGLRIKNPEWTGRRRAEGEIQAALSDMTVAYYDFLKASDEYTGQMASLENAYDAFERLQVKNEFTTNTLATIAKYHQDIVATDISLGFIEKAAKTAAEMVKAIGMDAADAIPKLVATLTGGVLEDTGAAAKIPVHVAWGITLGTAEVVGFAKETTISSLQLAIVNLETAIQTNDLAVEVVQAAYDLNDALAAQYIARDQLLSKLTSVNAAQQNYFTVLEKGNRLIAERARERSRAAQRIQQNRYTDMLFRIFRDEALQKYNTLFELAARYAYLSAKAYDYETGFLNASATHSAASQFLQQITRSSSLGRIQDGQPLPGGTQGDPGLADALARLKADWDVVKGRLGVNNPETEASRISMRQGLLRISPAAASDTTWQNALETYRVENLHDLAEFKKYCVPFTATTNREPGLVIPFSSWILAGRNFFGHPLAGGDSAYDPTYIATKIRSVGIWFSGYNVSFNTNATSGAGLANEPRVYLVPVGSDIMRTPARDRQQTRTWQVFDQVLPLPYNIGQTDLDQSDWIPLFDSLSGSFAQLRRHPSLRAYHDRGQFSDDELCTNARLVGRSVWNTQWLLIIPGRTLLADPDEGIERFIYGAADSSGVRNGAGITDIKIYFNTYSYPGD